MAITRSAGRRTAEHRPCCPTRRFFIIVTAILSCAVISPLATASIFFIAPWGTPLGDGTSDHPLDLATTLSSRSSAKPGDTLILLGGTYHGAFVSTLTGAENNPIIVRQAPRARATIDGNLTVQGAWATYWGLEVTNSDRDRSKSRPTAVNFLGPHTKFINMIVHGGGNGFRVWTPAVASEIDAGILYRNGWTGS